MSRILRSRNDVANIYWVIFEYSHTKTKKFLNKVTSKCSELWTIESQARDNENFGLTNNFSVHKTEIRKGNYIVVETKIKFPF